MTQTKAYVFWWNDGNPIKAEMFTNDLPIWTPVSRDEFFAVAIQGRAQYLIAEQKWYSERFGHEAIGL